MTTEKKIARLTANLATAKAALVAAEASYLATLAVNGLTTETVMPHDIIANAAIAEASGLLIAATKAVSDVKAAFSRVVAAA